MTFTKTIIAASSFVIAATTATLAQDSDKKFDGAYVGIEGGLDWTELATDTNSDNSLYYGGVIGYRKQMDSGLVFGLEGTFGDTGYGNSSGIKSNSEWSTSLTLGAAFGRDGANLIYGKAGYARTNFDASPADDDSFGDGGWRFGGGYERAINDKLSLRLGADYTDYGTDKSDWQTKAGVLIKF